MRDRRTNLYKMLGNTGLLLAIMLLLAYPRMSYSLDTSRVEILNSGYTAERGIGGYPRKAGHFMISAA